MSAQPKPKSNTVISTQQPTSETLLKDGSKQKQTVLESHGYTLGKSIGTGSYAIVRMAFSERHDMDVAVKIVSKFSAPADYLKKFLPREIEVVKGLRHPNLIRFLQAIETTHRVYIIMEYAQKGSLLDIIRKDIHIDDVRSRKWFRQLTNAVEYCHERGVVHRDIKCENLLMDENFDIKLSDFGFAKGHMKTKNGQTPLSETFCGSYAYASPEILKGIPYQPQMSDVWSMGVVLYAMVFGRLPFDDTNYKDLIKQVSNKVLFPKEPKVSLLCKSLINKILAPLKSRIRIRAIKNDPWLNQQNDSAHASNDLEGNEMTIKLLSSKPTPGKEEAKDAKDAKHEKKDEEKDDKKRDETTNKDTKPSNYQSKG